MNPKQRVAQHAANLVENGMTVGLGTGSTANCFIEALAKRIREDNLAIKVVSSSVISAIKAQQLDLPLVSLEQLATIDLYVDGADEVAPDLTLLKGRGYDLVREKILARAAEKFIVLVDPSKMVLQIGDKYSIPVEFMPFARFMVEKSLLDLGGKPTLRQNAAKDGLAITSYGSLVYDVDFASGFDVADLNRKLNSVPGVVEHGIFYDLTTSVLVGEDDGVGVGWSKPV